MKRQKIKSILSSYYSKDGVKSIFCGRMKPSYEVMLKLNKQHNIPFEAWKDIKSFINTNIPNTKENIKV